MISTRPTRSACHADLAGQLHQDRMAITTVVVVVTNDFFFLQIADVIVSKNIYQVSLVKL
jgi:hypothetical protein